jgi:glycine/D-amino acid oxidase-like deaminating enzyme
MRERDYRSKSLWLNQLPGPLEPELILSENCACDIAIVGAGFTGLWTAYYLKCLQPDLCVVVLEGEIAGFGASGRNAGWVSGGIAGRWRTYAKSRGTASVQRAIRETYSTIDEIGEVVARERIDCHYAKRGAITIATTRAQQQRLVGDVALMRSLGVNEKDIRMATPNGPDWPLPTRNALLAAYSRHCAHVDPARLIRGLLDACRRRGVRVYERSRVTHLSPLGVRCDGGVVCADHVIQATESYSNQLPGEDRRFMPRFSVVAATAPLDDAVWRELGWCHGLGVSDRRHLFCYAQRTWDDRLVIGCRGGPYRLREPTSEIMHMEKAIQRRLRQALRRYLPPGCDESVSCYWSGPLAVPRDWCMNITYDRSTGRGWAGGYGGHGVVASNIAGRTMADLVLGRQTDMLALPWVGRGSRSWEHEPLRYVASKLIAKALASADSYDDWCERLGGDDSGTGLRSLRPDSEVNA